MEEVDAGVAARSAAAKYGAISHHEHRAWNGKGLLVDIGCHEQAQEVVEVSLLQFLQSVCQGAECREGGGEGQGRPAGRGRAGTAGGVRHVSQY